MKDSQYIDSYLETTARGNLITPGTFLAYTLRGRAKRWAGRYEGALLRFIKRRNCKPVTSKGGRTAYVTGL